MAKIRKLDFTDVESFTLVPEGIQPVKVVSCEDTSSNSGDDMIKMTFEVTSGEAKGSRLFDNFVLTQKALWKLQQFLRAVGLKADGKIKLDLDKLPGLVCDASVFHEDYEGKTRAKIQEYTKQGSDDADDEDDEDEEEEEEKPAPKKSAKPAKEAPAPAKGKKKPEPEEDEEDEEEEDDEEEEEKPAPKKGKAAPAPAKGAKAEKASKGKAAPAKGKGKPAKDEDEDDDDDDDWEED